MAKGRKPPWFKFFPDWLLGSDLVREQRTDAVGAYVLLIASAWVRGLPNDDESLQRITGLGVKRWRALRPVLLAKFQLGEDGRLHHPVLDDLWTDYQQAQELGRRTGRKAQTLRDSAGKFQAIPPMDVTTGSVPKVNRSPSPAVTQLLLNDNELQVLTPREGPDRQPGKLEEEIEDQNPNAFPPALVENTPPGRIVDNSNGHHHAEGQKPDAFASEPGAGQGPDGPEPAPWLKYLAGVAPVTPGGPRT